MPFPTLRNHSYANVHEVKYDHLQWKFMVDFDQHKLKATAEYKFSYSGKEEHPTLVLDTNHLQVENVFVDGKKADFDLKETGANADFGRPLVVAIKPTSTKIKVEYLTTDESSGLQWLPKELTADKTHPYLFTQCQAIHARSMIPCPDTPGVKIPYDAVASVPDWCTCLLSALAQDDTPKANKATANGNRKVKFHQPVPMPSYLLAIVAGRLDSQDLGPRSRVWSEPSVVGKAAYEFAETEELMKHAEAITGQQYVWGRYDLVCLPPSFPYGGMENPCLTFVTPTLLAGDRSLANVIAHELAHSWTGNLITNRTWNDFWLNEGWTVWLERRIGARMARDPLIFDMEAALGKRDLVEAVREFGEDHAYTKLVLQSDNVDPDDTFSSLPYEKGFTFLCYLTSVVGGHDNFEAFFRAYVQRFKFQTLTAEDFKAFFMDYFTKQMGMAAEVSKIDWDAWYYSTGMPPQEVTFDTSKTEQAMALANKIGSTPDTSEWDKVVQSESTGYKAVVSEGSLEGWPTALWILLLDTMLLQQSEEGVTFDVERLDAIDEFCHHKFTTTKNAELRYRWYTLGLRSKDTRAVEPTVAFVKEQARMKFIRRLYRELARCQGVEYTLQVFSESKKMYHPIATKMIERDMEEAKRAEASGEPVFAGEICQKAKQEAEQVQEKVVEQVQEGTERVEQVKERVERKVQDKAPSADYTLVAGATVGALAIGALGVLALRRRA